MKNICSTLLLIAALATNAHAQIALEAGLNMSNMAITTAGNKLSTGLKPGAMAGILADLKMSDHVYFQPGVFYQDAGCNITGKPSGDYTVSTITIPLTFVYKTGEKCSNRWVFAFGPYLADNLSGSYTIEPYSFFPGSGGDLVIGSDNKSNLKGLDIGAHASVAYQTSKHFYFRLRYQMGFTNLNPIGDANNSIKTSALGVSIGYLFGRCNPGGYGSGRGGGNHWRGMSKSKYSHRTYNYHKPWLK